MNITIDISEGELDALDMTVDQLEEATWQSVELNIDPSENVETVVTINVYR